MIKALPLRTLVTATVLAGSLVAAQAQAQTSPRIAVRGKVETFSATSLTVKTRDGKDVKVALPANVPYRSVSKSTLADIKPGSFVGAAAVPEAGGKLKALEVHVFAASLNGSGEGFRPWEGAGGKKGTMTNGTVGNLQTTQGTTMVVKYKDGEKTIDVPKDVPVVSMDPADASVVKTGAPVLVFATKDSMGMLTAGSVIVSKDGTTPPM